MDRTCRENVVPDLKDKLHDVEEQPDPADSCHSVGTVFCVALLQCSMPNTPEKYGK